MASLTPYDPRETGGVTLLAPLQGLPFDQMVANGEGNRHAGDANYYRLILVHGLFASFAFLVFTPAAIICARFLIHGPKPRLSMWGHVGFQIASIICLTITFISGYFAIGRENWGKNPHHIIGATVYAAMLFQAFFGAFVRWRVNQKIRELPPLHKMLHQWLGRAVFCLGLANIPLGLYVYGSPKSLFVLYAVLVSLFILSWFSLEYLRNRGWFEHRYRNVGGGAVPVPEMSEHHSSDVSHQVPDMESGYSRVGAEDLQVQTPRKSRFSIGKMTWPFNRNSASKRSTENTIGVPYPGLYDGTTSVDTSRAPSAQSPAIGGLAPGPGRRDDVPPVPTLPIQYGQHRSSSSIPSADFQQRYGNPTGLKDTVLRDSTTLGPRPGQHLDMPEPVFSQPSPQYDQYPSQIAPVFGGSPRSSANTQQSSLPRPGQQYNMPVSPISGGGYMEDEHGFIPTPLQEESPRRPLPLPPHRRERSIDSTSRLPTSDVSAETFPSGEGQTILAGGGESSSGRRGQPNVAVQVKLNPDGKSVTVRRLNPEEAEQERRDRSRARQDRARQREIEIERERQLERTSRRSQSRRRQESVDRREEQESRNYEEDRREIQSPGATSYTASVSGVSGQSTTIAGASGGLLGRTTIGPQTPSSEQEPLSAMSPLIGMQPVARSPIPRGIMTSGQRGSTASGTVTAENSEIEQEIVKEQRRKKRREERAGTSQLGPGGSAAGGAAGGGFYGPAGSDSQWT